MTHLQGGKKLTGLALVLIAVFSVLWAQGLPFTSGQAEQTTQTTTTARPDFHSWKNSLHKHRPTNRGCFRITYPNDTWQSAHCVVGPSVPLEPMAPSAVGNGADELAYSGSGALIASSIGSFQSVSGLTSESDSDAGSNYYSMQINSQFFSTNTPYTNNQAALGWEQFVFINDPEYDAGFLYIQYWLINYESTYGYCPGNSPPEGTSWMVYDGSCYANSASTTTPLEGASNLADLTLEGDANINSNDENLFCITGGSCYNVSPPANVLDLYQNWRYSEFNIFGFCCASTADFNSGTALTVANALQGSSGNAITPSCVEGGYTGETNNLNLVSCSSNSGGEILFSENNGQGISPQASVSPTSVVQGQAVSYAGSGFTPNHEITVVIDSGSGYGYIVGTPTASSAGAISGSFTVGTNILPGTRQVTFTDTASGLTATADLTVAQLTATVSTTTATSTLSTLTSSTSTYLTTTTTSSTSISTSTVGQLCSATSITQTTGLLIQGTSSSTSTTTTTTSQTSTFVTTTSATSTSTYVTATTTTTTECTQTSTSTSTNTFFTTYTRPSTGITLDAAPTSAPVGSSVVFSGSVSPNPGVVLVTISFSRDSGTTWALLLSVMSNGSGLYSAGWMPPSPGNYLLKASWDGNEQLASSQSSTISLTVTGSVQQTPTVLLSAPPTATQGQTMTLSVTVLNPSGSDLNATISIQLTGPNNYTSFDVVQLRVGGNSQSTGFYDWPVPYQPGTYTVVAGLLPPTPGGVDLATVQVT